LLPLALAVLSTGATVMANNAPSPIAVAVVKPNGVDLDDDLVLTAIARELGRPVIRADETGTARALLRIVVDTELQATVYYHEAEEALTRTIRLPADPARAAETLALLAGNLARDQVLELAQRFVRPSRTDEADNSPSVVPSLVPVTSVTRPPVARPLSLLPPEARYRGRVGIYAMVGGGSSLQGSPIVPVIVGVALRWRLAALALEGLGGLWSGGYAGADVAIMLHHTAGPLLLGGGIAGGAVAAFANHPTPVGLARAFMRMSWAARPSVDLFAQLDFGYGRETVNNINVEGLMLSLGVQVRLLR
jgi:hypothetical protein